MEQYKNIEIEKDIVNDFKEKLSDLYKECFAEVFEEEIDMDKIIEIKGKIIVIEEILKDCKIDSIDIKIDF